ncbi:tyrosine-type recombinase/integrase [Sphingobacterium hungaricum]
MYIEVRAINATELTQRGYVIFYFNSKRYRFFNGKHLGLDIQTNRAMTQKKKSVSLELLKFKTTEALNNGWNPENGKYLKMESLKSDCVRTIFESVLYSKLTMDLSTSYKSDLSYLVTNFLGFLTKAEKDNKITELKNERIVEFLNGYNSSATNYNNKRRMLSVIFNNAIERGYLLDNPVRKTRKQKQKIVLNEVYSDKQLKNLFIFLKENNDDLYCMALIMYGCLLRPHTEILSLTKSNFNDDYTKIVLGGKQNKSGNIRIVNVPEYVREAIRDRIHYLTDDNVNLFSLSDKRYNIGYFNTLWDRLKIEMKSKNLLKENQTIYSIRHTSAVKIYRKSKDVSIVQKMMGHSNMTITLTYLRSLGQMEVESLIEFIPMI